MTTLTEGPRTGEFIVSEAPHTRSRDAIIVGVGAALLAGTVLGVTYAGTAVVTPGTPFSTTGGTVGNGAVGTWTADAGDVMPGTWNIVITGTGATAAYKLVRPDGTIDGYGAVATAYNGSLNGTLADGANDWLEGDTIPIVITGTSAQHKKLDLTKDNGLQIAAGILYAAAGSASVVDDGVAVTRDAEVNDNLLTWPAGITNAQKAAAVAQLGKRGIIVRA